MGHKKDHGNKHSEIIQDTHHIYAKSRFPDLTYTSWNKVKVYRVDHEKYHRIFDTKTPEEIAVYLAQNFWGGHVEIIENVMRALQKLL